MKWAERNSKQLSSVSKETICVLPLGATEQHGPHLPVGTDQFIADGLAERLDAACGGKLLVLPGLPAGCSAHHMAFPGTLSLEHRTFADAVIQVVKTAATHGLHRFLLLNAHGGNIAIGGVITEQLSAVCPEAEVMFGTWFRMAADPLHPLVEGSHPAVGHACEFETSLMMVFRPELVDASAIVDEGAPPSSPLFRGDLLTAGPVTRSVPFHKFTRSGVWGKPSLASPEKGRAILEVTLRTIRDLLRAQWSDAPGLEADLDHVQDKQARELRSPPGAGAQGGSP
jgi:creatinine amidohydrolase